MTVAPFTHVETCDYCGESHGLRVIDRHYCSQYICRECFGITREADVTDFHDWPLLHPITPANNAHGPQEVPQDDTDDAPQFVDPDWPQAARVVSALIGCGVLGAVLLGAMVL